VPSKMNPVEEDGNQFAQLFEKMPAKRIGKSEDIAGTILYLCSQAGVSQLFDCCLLLRMNKR
jgi:NAD(P)-dependent dehydrogenase (short-subunit alcohol dehydrogenase family)